MAWIAEPWSRWPVVERKVTEAHYSPECEVGLVPNHWGKKNSLVRCSCGVTLDFCFKCNSGSQI